VTEVSFDSWTEDGHLRAPVFVRLRDDIEVDSVVDGPTKKKKAQSKPTAKNEIESVLEQLEGTSKQLELSVAGAKLRLTNLDREYWPAAEKSPAIDR
jgi:bifunctional non-homologous end joining protein LigD